MKTLKITLAALCLTLIATTATAQKTKTVAPAKKEAIATKPVTVAPVVAETEIAKPVSNATIERMYIVEAKELATYFLSGQIPADFPKYDNSLTEEQNVKIAKEYGFQHKDLLTEAAIAKYEL